MVLNNNKAVNELGWTPRMNIEQGIAEAVSIFNSN
jgi:nucleoside-diphosphate-sugar epimerase